MRAILVTFLGLLVHLLANAGELKNYYTFTAKGRDFVVLDYSRRKEFSSNHETICFYVELLELKAKGPLHLIESKEYRCDVNSSLEYLQSKDFYHPYQINRAKPSIEDVHSRSQFE